MSALNINKNKIFYINAFNNMTIAMIAITGFLSATLISYFFEGQELTPLAFSLTAPSVILFFNMLLLALGNSRFMHTFLCLVIFLIASVITLHSGGAVHEYHAEINLYFGVCWGLLWFAGAIADLYTMEISNSVIKYARSLKKFDKINPDYFSTHQKKMIRHLQSSAYDVPSKPTRRDLLALDLRMPSINYFKRIDYFIKHCHQVNRVIYKSKTFSNA